MSVGSVEKITYYEKFKGDDYLTIPPPIIEFTYTCCTPALDLQALSLLHV
jgi:hypothetical protein